MLIHNNKHVHRFQQHSEAHIYALEHYRGSYDFYVIVDTVEDKVVENWCY